MRSNLQFHNFPVFYSIEEYERAKHVYTREALQCYGVESIYQLGSLSSPGISDMDFIFVVDPRAISYEPVPPLPELHTMLGGDVHYLICHEPMGILTGKLLSDICWLLPTSGFRVVSGREFDIHAPSKKDFHILKLLALADYTRVFWPWEFLRATIDGSIDVRMTLLRLNSFSHSLNEYGSLSGDKNFGLDFREGIKDLRTRWFFNDQEKNLKVLVGLLEGSVPLGWLLIERLSSLLMEEAGRYGVAPKLLSAEFENVRKYYFFSDMWTFHKAENLFRQGYAGFDLRIHFLPTPLVWPLAQYSQAEGLLSRRIRHNLHVYTDIPKMSQVQSMVLSKRASLMNEHLEFVSAFGWLSGLFNPNSFGMFDEGRLHPSKKKWLHTVKTLYCWHMRKPFFRNLNRRILKKVVEV